MLLRTSFILLGLFAFPLHAGNSKRSVVAPKVDQKRVEAIVPCSFQLLAANQDIPIDSEYDLRAKVDLWKSQGRLSSEIAARLEALAEVETQVGHKKDRKEITALLSRWAEVTDGLYAMGNTARAAEEKAKETAKEKAKKSRMQKFSLGLLWFCEMVDPGMWTHHPLWMFGSLFLLFDAFDPVFKQTEYIRGGRSRFFARINRINLITSLPVVLFYLLDQNPNHLLFVTHVLAVSMIASLAQHQREKTQGPAWFKDMVLVEQEPILPVRSMPRDLQHEMQSGGLENPFHMVFNFDIPGHPKRYVDFLVIPHENIEETELLFINSELAP